MAKTGRRDTIREFRTRVAADLPPGYEPAKCVPTFRNLLTVLKQSGSYAFYKLASQYVHGTHVSTWLYRRDLGAKKRLGEFVAPRDWHAPLLMTWYSLHSAGRALFERFGGDANEYLPEELGRRVQEAIDRIGTDVKE